MKFNDYIGIGPDEFKIRYIDPGYVQVAHHKEFPLSIYTYGRKTVHENLWDAVTSKCRGIIVNRETGDIVARPFEKFHNYGSNQQELVELQRQATFFHTIKRRLVYPYQPTVWEKMDGFLATGYQWNRVWYVASKGSFHSIHAKWATSELRRYERMNIPKGYTPVMEGLHPDLRIVVDYGQRKELVLLALINIETGEEISPSTMGAIAAAGGMKIPRSWDMRLDEAVNGSRDTRVTGAEGYVLTWYHLNRPPSRLKLKFVEYLRLHRMVTGVSPKRIWECLASGSSELRDYVSQSTPWFAAFTQKWVRALTEEYQRIKTGAEERYAIAKLHINRLKFGQEPFANLGAERKAWALEFQKPAYEGYQSILFGMLDNKPLDRIYWNQVKHMTSGANPMVDAHNT